MAEIGVVFQHFFKIIYLAYFLTFIYRADLAKIMLMVWTPELKALQKLTLLYTKTCSEQIYEKWAVPIVKDSKAYFGKNFMKPVSLF